MKITVMKDGDIATKLMLRKSDIKFELEEFKLFENLCYIIEGSTLGNL